MPRNPNKINETFDGFIQYVPLEDITTYELAQLTYFVARGRLSDCKLKQLLKLPKNVLRHFVVKGGRLSEVDINLDIECGKRSRLSKLLGKIKTLFNYSNENSK